MNKSKLDNIENYRYHNVNDNDIVYDIAIDDDDNDNNESTTSAVDESPQELEKILPVNIQDKQTEMIDKKKNLKKFSFKDKFVLFRNSITVEPMLACYVIPSVLASLATQNLNLEKACRINLAYPTELCDALTRRETANYTLEEKNIQTLVASMAGWKTFLQSALPCVLILFWGSWSDRHGRRKPCMLIPIIGEFITSIGLMLCTYFDQVPMEVAGVTEALFPGLTGGWFTMFMGVFSYIADVTTEEERTLRIGIVNLFVSLGVPIGMAFSGILLKQIGFYGVFSISATMYLFAFFYGVFVVKEFERPKAIEMEKSNEPKKSRLADFFDKEHVVETFKVAFKEGENQRRLRVIMLMIVVMVVIGPMHGEMSVFYLFTRFRFNWSEVQFSFFSTYAMLTSLIGTMFSVGVFSHMFKVNDALIGVISSMSKIISSFVYAFAVTPWQLYLGPIAEILNGTSFIAMRSIASKLVCSAELGKVNSLFGVAESLMPLLYAPMYATVYQATLNTLPGAFFLLGGALTFPAVIIFLWMYKVSKREEKLNPNGGGDLTDNVKNGKIPTLSEVVVDKHKSESISNLSISRMGSFRKRDSNATAATNSPKITSSHHNSNQNVNVEGILQETVEIVKDLPALHLEHCKL